MWELLDDFAVGQAWEVSDECMERHEMQNLPYERDDIQSRRVVRVSEELHQCVDDAGSNFRELDGSDMDGLNQQLPVFRDLDPREELIKQVIHQAPRNDTLS